MSADTSDFHHRLLLTAVCACPAALPQHGHTLLSFRLAPKARRPFGNVNPLLSTRPPCHPQSLCTSSKNK
jgi:hypothetical protein